MATAASTSSRPRGVARPRRARARARAIPPRNSAAQFIPVPTDRRRPPRERFNLVLVDVMMPGLNGLEVLEQIRRRYGNEIAVIMISSNDQQQMVEDCIRHGADSYLIKPLRKSDFSNIWQFVMQSSCQKLRLKHAQSQAEKRELKLQRWQQEAELKQVRRRAILAQFWRNSAQLFRPASSSTGASGEATRARGGVT